MNFRVLGITDEITSCDCCGKTGLKCTVELENLDTNDVVHYGRDCAGAAVRGGHKHRSKTEMVEMEARAVQKLKPVIEAVKAALPQGITAANAAGNAVIEARKAERRPLLINGMGVSVVGFRSWGFIEIGYNGGRVSVLLPNTIAD